MESLTITWWAWVLFGLLLLLGEILTPGGFFICFFGAGAIAIGLLKLLGWNDSFVMEGLAFAVLSVVALGYFRRPLMRRFRKLTPDIAVDTLIGETAIAKEDIGVNAVGKVELRGTAWNARNLGPAPIARAARCAVERVEGLTLFIRAQ